MLNPAEQRTQFSPQGRGANVEPQQATWVDDDTDLLSPNYSSDYGSPYTSSRPLTLSSGASDGSSIGEIPDFPIPAAGPGPQQFRRSSFIGPPPSARRGPSSYYSQASYVSPIVEESERSRDSYASSSVIPEFYNEEQDVTPSETDERTPTGSRESTAADHTDRSGLVRQASLGKRGKPALTTIRSGENVRPEDNGFRFGLPSRPGPNNGLPANPRRAPQPGQRAPQPGPTAAAGAGAGAVAAAFANREDLRHRPESVSLSSGTGLLDPSPASSTASSPVDRSFGSNKEMLFDDLKPPTAPPRARSPLAPVDPEVDKILGGLQQGGALSPEQENALRSSKTGGSFMERRAGSRRPPRLNVDAVRDAEARGSLTSLPDLIRRATRLAGNLERGRTASRLGMDWMVDEKQKEARDARDVQDRRSAGSLTDILASFPPPALGTPRSAGSRSGSPAGAQFANVGPRKPGNLVLQDTPPWQTDSNPDDDRKKRRRCCGMPLWVFWTLILILFLLIIAAVIVPIVLIVIPRDNSNNTNQGAQAAMDQCMSTAACLNGGSTTINPNGTCGCLCPSGFTGPTCATSSDPSCGTFTTSTNTNTTIGNAIPRLIEAAPVNYSVPLNSTGLLSTFNNNKMSCTTQNALVTFNGAAEKRSINIPDRILEFQQTAGGVAIVPHSPQEEPLSPKYIPPPDRRDEVTARTVNDPGTTQTSNGILFAASSASATEDSTATPTTSTQVAASTTSSPQHTLDFARISVLFALQTTGNLNTAVNLQEQLQSLLQNGGLDTLATNTAATNISVGSGIRINLVACTITDDAGDIIGGLVS